MNGVDEIAQRRLLVPMLRTLPREYHGHRQRGRAQHEHDRHRSRQLRCVLPCQECAPPTGQHRHHRAGERDIR